MADEPGNSSNNHEYPLRQMFQDLIGRNPGLKDLDPKVINALEASFYQGAFSVHSTLIGAMRMDHSLQTFLHIGNDIAMEINEFFKLRSN